MIYSHSFAPVNCVHYETFCYLMEIPYGAGSASLRSPAECRMVAAFQYAVNSGRGGAFTNWNLHRVVVVPVSLSRYQSWTRGKKTLKSGFGVVESQTDHSRFADLKARIAIANAKIQARGVGNGR